MEMRDQLTSGSTRNDGDAVRAFVSLVGPLSPLLAHHPLPLMVCSGRTPDDPIVFVNDLFAHLTGYTKDELVGLRVANLIVPAIEGAGTISWLPKDRHPKQEVVLLRKDGTSSRNALSIIPDRGRQR